MDDRSMGSIMFPRTSASVLLLFFVLFVEAHHGYDREPCFAKLQTAIRNGTISRNSSIFYRSEHNVFMSDPENPILTVPGCEKVCGDSFGWYNDIGPRLSTWLIPVFLLLTNMEVSPLDKRRYLMLLHLLRDPISSLHCLLLKLEAWSRCHEMAKNMCHKAGREARSVATVLGGFEELIGFYANPADVYKRILKWSGKVSTREKKCIARAALRLAQSRTDERLRTLLATVLYIYQLVSAFITVVGGGNTSPPGGRIGLAMFMTWTIPPVLVSNAIGCFTSRRICFDILDDFVRDVNPNTDLWTELQNTVPEIHRYGSVEEYFDSLSWRGAVYSYRPSTHLKFKSDSNDCSPTLILLLAFSPTVISSTIASLILWHTPPIGLNCRNILIFSIFAAFVASCIITWLCGRVGLRGAAHWHAVLAKDALVAIPSVIMIFLATSGLFNSCRCWSGVYSLGAKALVPMNPEPEFILWGRTVYPILVGSCVALLVSAFIAMMWMGWNEWNVMRWSEERQLAWIWLYTRRTTTTLDAITRQLFEPSTLY